jgi:hypothetical protein
MSQSRNVILVLFCLAALGAMAVLAGETGVSTFEKTLSLTPGQSVSVSFRGSDGDVSFVPGRASEVVVKVRKETDLRDEARARRLLAEVKVDVSQVGNSVRVEIRRPRSWGFSLLSRGRRVRVRSEIALPPGCGLEARTSDGSVSASGLSGSLMLRTSDGDIRVRGAEGRVEARSSDGDIDLLDIKGEVRAAASDGKIEVSGVLTGLDLESSDGDITVRALPGSRMERGWEIVASDGDVEAALPADFSAELRLHASDGSLSCSLPVALRGRNSRHDLEGTLGSGGSLLHIRTSDGDVTLKTLRVTGRRP